jgi:hypothetical protein
LIFRLFEDMAIGVLEIFDKNTSEAVDDVLIIRYIRQLEIDHLELAYICKCKKFMSNSLVQRVLDNIWTGKKPIKDVLVNNHLSYFYKHY